MPESVPDLAEVEDAVEAALRSGRPEGLDIIGYGEITLVIGWPPESRQWALKRLPLFDDLERLFAYKKTLFSYMTELEKRGAQVIETELSHVERADGRLAAYVVQPSVPRGHLLVEELREVSASVAAELLERLAGTISSVVGDTVGMDAQVSNWAILGGDLVYFDVSTPLMRDSTGRNLLDVDVFLASLPAVLRAPVKRLVAEEIISTYFNLRSVFVDVAANLYKDGIEAVLPVFLEAANRFVSPPITEKEAYRYHRRDAFLWSSLQRARRLDRWWQQKIRRRTYPFLLPPTVYAGRKA